ncbi:MAG: DUF4279 domain-containing protein [Verrucomicrobiota bacterium]|jgi:hypothetical protein
MSCLLRATGENFEVDAFLQTSKLRPNTVQHKGQLRRKNKPDGGKSEFSGLSCVVSEKDFNDLEGQIAEAIEFLKSNRVHLQKLVKFPGIEDVRLDFGIERRDEFSQCDYFPSKLLCLAGELGIGIELSQYPISPKQKTK